MSVAINCLILQFHIIFLVLFLEGLLKGVRLREQTGGACEEIYGW